MPTERPSVIDVLGETDELVSNIVKCWSIATDTDRNDGRTWYDRAHEIAARLDPEAPDRAAAVIAALSPQVSWGENVRLARRAYALGYASGTFSSNTRKADRILHAGETPDSVLGGPKVRAFFALICDPTNDYDVCVDRHAVAIAVGCTLSDRQRKVLERKGAYDHVADAYRRAAKLLEVAPHVVQATTWITWRRHNANNATDHVESPELF